MSSEARKFRKLAVIGAGNMGSGIAQKMATEGFNVILVDLDDDKVARGMAGIRETLAAGVERRIFKPDQAQAIEKRVQGTSDWSALADVDLVVEAVFENLEVKQQVFKRLEEHVRPDTILGTNTSSFFVADVARATEHPERVVGLHYFFHPAKNRLVEVVPGPATDREAIEASWLLQEQLGKTPIGSADAAGFVVNRFFVPWLNEAVRLLAEDVADIPTIDAACKKTFGVGMGPFELMNVTGVPIALHAATTLGEQFGPFYAPDDRLAQQVAAGEDWPLAGEPDEERFAAVERRMLAPVFHVAAALVDERVGTIEDTDIGARVGLRWPRGPFEMMNRVGVEQAAALVDELAGRWEIKVPRTLLAQVDRKKPFRFELVKYEVADGVATLTLNRPDAMNALNETVVQQLYEAFRRAAGDHSVKGIVIAGAGKGFIAGADIRFFVKNIQAGHLDRIVAFTRAGQDLLNEIDDCPKPVVARMDGITLGGGLELALACDRIVATPKAMMAFPETGIGIYPGLGGTQRAPRRVGKGLAKWLIYTGQMLDARTAAGIGLIDRMVDHGELDAAIREALDAGPAVRDSRRADIPAGPFAAIADFFDTHGVQALSGGDVETGDNAQMAKAVKKIGGKAPIALRLAEKLIDGGFDKPLGQGLELEMAHLEEIFATEDALVGLRSLGRARPEFKGR